MFTKAYYCRLDFLTSDKEIYYINDDIKINTSWELNYNPETEFAFIQVQIYNRSNNLLWTSLEFNDIGSLEKNWIINCSELNFSLSNYSDILYIKFFSYYFHFDSTNTVATFLETRIIKIVKRNLSCQLSGFKNNINYGENMIFDASFYDSSSEGQDLTLNNQTILFKVISNNNMIYQNNYTTNLTGVINLFLNSKNDLKLGDNKLIFTFKDNKIYNDSKFIFEAHVGKNPIFIDILKFKDNLSTQEDLEISLFYHYFNNHSLIPLVNKCIKIKIFENSTLRFINEYVTDNLGMLNILLANKIFNFEQESIDLIISLIFDGSYELENRTLNLKLKVTESPNLINQNSLLTSYLPISLALIAISIIISFIFVNRKKRNEKLLTDIIIKY
jgi:hypothetical protein